MDEGYDLRQETNGFLAQLAKGLSEENETALALIRKTFGSLKDMSGWGKDNEDSEGSAASKGDNRVVELSVNPEELLPDMDGVLSHLRTMLSNPAFVPVEELEARDEEIFRLRDGWEKMEVRWQEAVRLIDSWRRRMAADGRPVDIEELKMGLRLSPVRVNNVAETAQAEHLQLSTLMEEDEDGQSSFAQQQGSPSPPESLHLVPADDYQDMVPEYGEAHDGLDDSDSESSIFQDDVDADIDMEDLDIIEPNVEILQESAASFDESPSSTLPPPPKITPLEETNLAGNRKPPQETTEKSRKRSGHLIEDTASQSAEAPTPPAHGTQGGQSPQKRLKMSKDVPTNKPESRPHSGIFTNSNSSLDSVLLLEPAQDSTSSKASSRTTARSTRSATSSKKPSPAPPAKPVSKTTRAASQEKKEPPAKPLTRQRSARAIAPTASSSSRTARSKPEPAKPRATTTAAAAAMPPPPRPTTRTSSNSSHHTNSPAAQLVQSTPQAQQKKSSAADNKPPTTAQQHASLETSTTTTTTTTDSPHRHPSPTKSASRLPRSKAINALLPAPHQSPVTVAGIAAKLAASEREANAARVRAKLKAARLGKNNSNNNNAAAVSASGMIAKQARDASGASSAASASVVSADENGLAGGVSIIITGEEAAAAPRGGSAASSSNSSSSINSKSSAGGVPSQLSPAKRRGGGVVEASDDGGESKEGEAATKRKREVRSRAARVASRRRSTLSPWELRSLISGDVAPGVEAEEGG